MYVYIQSPVVYYWKNIHICVFTITSSLLLKKYTCMYIYNTHSIYTVLLCNRKWIVTRFLFLRMSHKHSLCVTWRLHDICVTWLDSWLTCVSSCDNVHVTHDICVTCHTWHMSCESRISHEWVTNESRMSHEWVMNESRMRHVTHDICHVSHEWVTNESRMSHEWVTNESRMSHEWVTCHTSE